MEIGLINNIINRAMILLPEKMDTPRARMMLVATGMQESKFMYRKQMGDGPARSFWQFEKGNARSRGGVWGVMNHKATAAAAQSLAHDRGVAFDAAAIWSAMETDDVLGCAFARLLLWTDAFPLPDFHEEQKAWAYYIRCWNPGKPKPDSWPQAFRPAAAYYVAG